MPDITMCKGTGCPKKETCYRFTATPDKYWQSWFAGMPARKNEECPYYMQDWRKEAAPHGRT